eukprot:TRINITY_DN115622_c0_g1_i1.p1 TRINITY_DN115622_c0_g1~~TRINITY_DN115622_c0_g1_i1.p1  ORF type:complete len:455 (+),score=213.68 TRINITY_DN115622_c0_g1_i1:206-1570(+)
MSGEDRYATYPKSDNYGKLDESGASASYYQTQKSAGWIGGKAAVTPYADEEMEKQYADPFLGNGAQANEFEAEEPYRHIIIVTISMFMGYAVLVSFQHKLKAQDDISDTAGHASHEFGFAVSFLYIGNLVFRLAHNFIFAPILPRRRVYVAMCSMMVSMAILGIGVYGLGWKSIAWVYIAYVLGGVGIGSFESNLLSAITPLGHATKMWAIIGFPLGFAAILVGGFGLTALHVHPMVIYLIVLCALACSTFVFAYTIPVVNIESNAQSFDDFVVNMREWRGWLPSIGWHCIALALNMFNVSLFSGVMLYILNGKKVPLFGPRSTEVLVPHDWFFVVYNMFTLAGDSLSRKFAYWAEPRHPFVYLILTVVGAAICLSKYAIVAPIGIFLVFFTNGAIYATSTRHIDMHVPKQYNLIALSFWLFIGDFGSVTGSNVIAHVRDLVCTHHLPNMCTKR